MIYVISKKINKCFVRLLLSVLILREALLCSFLLYLFVLSLIHITLREMTKVCINLGYVPMYALTLFYIVLCRYFNGTHLRQASNVVDCCCYYYCRYYHFIGSTYISLYY